MALESGRAHVVFEEPQRVVTPGQAAVFYKARSAGGTSRLRSASRPSIEPAGMSRHDRRHSSANRMAALRKFIEVLILLRHPASGLQRQGRGWTGYYIPGNSRSGDRLLGP